MQRWIYLIYILLKDPSTAIISEEAAATLPETARQLVRDTKARRLVPEHPDPVLKAVRCLYTDVFPKRGFTNINSKAIVGINVERT